MWGAQSCVYDEGFPSLFRILSLGQVLLKAKVRCLLFRKNVLFEHRCLFESCSGIATGCKLIYMRHETAGSPEQAEMFPSGSAAPQPSSWGRAGALQLVWGCQELDWGKRKIVYVRFWHGWEAGWKWLIAEQHYNKGSFNWKAWYWCVLEASQLLCQLSDSEF